MRSKHTTKHRAYQISKINKCTLAAWLALALVGVVLDLLRVLRHDLALLQLFQP